MALEKLNFQYLYKLHKVRVAHAWHCWRQTNWLAGIMLNSQVVLQVAEDVDDAQFSDFVEEMLAEQVHLLAQPCAMWRFI